jgi:hypothetical protein
MSLRRAGLGITLSFALLSACAREAEKPPVDTTTSQPVGVHLPPSVPGLGTLAGEVDGQFTEIAAVEELSDGRVLVLDARRRLVVADFASGKGEVIGGRGGGPKEHGDFIPTLARQSGGAIWFPDGGNDRFGVVAANGGLANPVLPKSMTVFAALGSADTVGHWYMHGRGNGDSTAVYRVPATGGLGTPLIQLARVPLRNTTTETSEDPAAGVSIMSIEISPNQWTDAWAAFANGDLIVARTRPFRLELLDRSGQRTVGPEIAYDPIPLRDTLSKRQGLKAKPPFFSTTHSEPIAAPDGSFWLRRTTAADDGAPEYDVFDHALKLVRHVVLPANTDLVTVGTKHGYLTSDAPDGPRLVRYAF